MNIKRILTAAAAFSSAFILAGAMAAPVSAQMVSAPNLNGTPNTYYGKNHPYTERFDSYLDGHPDIAQQLHDNPKLINNPQYLKAHPGLREYLRKHPNVAQAYREHPEKFMRREGKYENSEGHWDNRHGEAYQHRHDKDWNQHNWKSRYEGRHEQHD